LSTLPACIRDTTPSTLAIEASNLTCWRTNILNTPASKVDTSALVNVSPGTNMLDGKVGVALQCLHLARERLTAFVAGDQERYRKACISGLCARAHLENLMYAQFMSEFLDEYKGWVEEEEGRRIEAGEQDEIGEDKVEELASEFGRFL
jgi:hypothetical protein